MRYSELYSQNKNAESMEILANAFLGQKKMTRATSFAMKSIVKSCNIE